MCDLGRVEVTMLPLAEGTMRLELICSPSVVVYRNSIENQIKALISALMFKSEGAEALVEALRSEIRSLVSVSASVIALA